MGRGLVRGQDQGDFEAVGPDINPFRGPVPGEAQASRPGLQALGQLPCQLMLR